MKYLYWVLGIGILIGLLAYAVLQKPVQETPNESTVNENSSTVVEQAAVSDKTSTTAELNPGIYTDYSEDAIGSDGFDRTILFFYAPWCPECRSFDQIIEDSKIPDGVQVLRTDYDSSTDLRKKYGVTIQTSFVGVDKSGEKLKLWSGYGQAKLLDAILDNTK